MTHNNIGELLVTKAKELDPTYKPDNFNDAGEALSIILEHISATSPTPEVAEVDVHISWDPSLVEDDAVLEDTDTFKRIGHSLQRSNRLITNIAFTEGMEKPEIIMHLYRGDSTSYSLGNIRLTRTAQHSKSPVGTWEDWQEPITAQTRFTHFIGETNSFDGNNDDPSFSSTTKTFALVIREDNVSEPNKATLFLKTLEIQSPARWDM